MTQKIILSADSTCDLTQELRKRYQVPGKEISVQNSRDQRRGMLRLF